MEKKAIMAEDRPAEHELLTEAMLDLMVQLIGGALRIATSSFRTTTSATVCVRNVPLWVCES